MALVASVVTSGLTAQSAEAAGRIDATISGPSTTTTGQTATFTGTITTTEAFTSVTIEDDASTGLTAIVPTGPAGAVGVGTFPYSVTAQISGAAGTQAELKLKITGMTAVAPANPVVQKSSGPFTVLGAPAVTLSITAAPPVPGPVLRDTDIQYVIKATNAGGAAIATNVEVSFPTPPQTVLALPAPTSTGTDPTPPFVAGSTATVKTTFDTLAGGASGTLTVTVHVSPTATKTAGAPPNDIVATATATFGPGAGVAPPASAAHELTPAADLTLSIAPVTPPPVSSQKKKTVDVTVSVGNNGPDPATGTKTVTIDLIDPSGNGTILPPSPGSGCTGTAVQVICTFATDLAPSPALPKTFTVKVRSDDPTSVEVKASLSTTGTEIDGNSSNNADVKADITFTQSTTDFFFQPPATPVSLIFGVPNQVVTFVLKVADPNPAPNNGDPAEGVEVKIAIPDGVQATDVSFGGASTGTCPVPGGPGVLVTCTVGNVVDGGTVTFTVKLTGTTFPGGGNVTATATATNLSPTPDLTPNSATVVVAVIQQPVDLSVNDVADAFINTSGPAVLTGDKDFVVTVTNGATFAAPFTLTVDMPTPTPGLTLGSLDADCVASAGNTVLTCSRPAGLPASSSTSFTIKATISVPGPITLRSRVALTSPTQIDPTTSNNQDTWVVTRNLPPNAQADIGPTLPAGATLVFDVLNNDTDGDAGDVPNLAVQTPVTGGGDLVISLEGKKLKVVVPGNEAPATFDLGFAVIDGRTGSTPSLLKVKVVAPLSIPPVNGSYANRPPTPPQSFNQDVAPALLGKSVNTLDLLPGDLSKRADGSAFAAAPAPGATTYALTSVDQNSINVDGSTATVADATKVTYTPADGYTTDPPNRTPTDLVQAPDDSFTYLSTGTRDNVQIFTVETKASIKVRNQNPIGLDTLIKINPGSGPADVQPASNDIDGNTLLPTAPGIRVKNGDRFVFDDEGKKVPQPAPPIIHGLQVKCIGPVPTLDPGTGLPVGAMPPNCTYPAMKAVGEPLDVPALVGSGKITATLNADLKNVKVAIDPTVAGLVPFAAVVVDNYGGAAWSLVTIDIPDTPPEIIPGKQTVPMNSPPVVVLDTRLTARDANGDPVKVSSITQPAHGKAEITDGGFTITYTPTTGYFGPDSLVLNVSDGRGGVASNQAQLNIDVVQPTTQPVAISSSPTAAGGGSAAGATPAGGPLAKTGGDPVALVLAAGLSLLLGFALVHAGRRRQTLPLLAQARHLRA